jgi:hypothetical protein
MSLYEALGSYYSLKKLTALNEPIFVGLDWNSIKRTANVGYISFLSFVH